MYALSLFVLCVYVCICMCTFVELATEGIPTSDQIFLNVSVGIACKSNGLYTPVHISSASVFGHPVSSDLPATPSPPFKCSVLYVMVLQFGGIQGAMLDVTTGAVFADLKTTASTILASRYSHHPSTLTVFVAGVSVRPQHL